MPERADRAQAFEVGDRLARPELGGEHRRIGRNHGVARQPALEAEARHAEIRVLIGHLAVAGVVGRFRNAPRDVLRAGILHLPLDDQVAGLAENAAMRLLHDQRRHQVLEHRARPRHQRAAEADLDDRPAKPEPVIGRDVALGDREQAGQTRLGGEQIVAALVELPFLDAVADRQQVALLPQQEREIHAEGDRAGPLAQRLRAWRGWRRCPARRHGNR